MEHTIYCTGPGNNPPFPVNILLTETVGELKNAIKAKIPDQVGGCTANLLKLYRKHQGFEVELDNPFLELSHNSIFGQNGPLKASVLLQHEHIVVRLPESESVDSALGDFPDSAFHMIVVVPAGESIMTTTSCAERRVATQKRKRTASSPSSPSNSTKRPRGSDGSTATRPADGDVSGLWYRC